MIFVSHVQIYATLINSTQLVIYISVTYFFKETQKPVAIVRLIIFCNIKIYETSDYQTIDLISKASYQYRFAAVLYVVPVNMNTLILICLICCVWPISGAEKDAYCFQYTWPGPMYANSSSVNCTSDKFKGVPCIAPIIVGSRPPNISYLWDKWDKETKLNPHLCTLQDGYACISYSYIYNNAVLNTSHYCGKIIEDKTVAITSGCFYYKVDGHIIEVCACRSTGSKPCNTATKQTSSAITLLSSVVMLFYNFYNK